MSRESFDQEETHDFLENDEILEEQLLDENDQIPMDDDVDNEEDDNVDTNEPILDDSAQGFFDHKESIYAVDINPVNEEMIVSGGGDNKGYMWRSDTGEKLYELSGHTDSVISVSFSKDGKYIASGGMDGKIMIWKVENGQHVITLEGPNEITWLDWHPKGNVILAGTTDSTIWMWQIPSGNFMNLFAGHSASVTAGQFTPDGKKIVSGSEDSSLIIWDPKNAGTIFKLSSNDSRFHQEEITSLAINKESSLILTGSMDHSAKLVNLTNGHIIGSFENHTDSIETVGFSDMLSLAATGSVDSKLNIWDVTTMRLRQTCQHDDTIVKLQWHQESPLITTCSVDKTVRIWDYRTGNCEKIFHGHHDTILGFAMSRDGKKIVTAGDDHACLVFKY